MTSSALLVIALGVLAFALLSARAERGIVTAPMVFTAFGLAIGSGGLGLVELPFTDGAIDQLAEITLVIVLFGDASRIDISRPDREHDLPARLLALGLPLRMAAGTVLAVVLFPSLTWAEASPRHAPAITWAPPAVAMARMSSPSAI